MIGLMSPPSIVNSCPSRLQNLHSAVQAPLPTINSSRFNCPSVSSVPFSVPSKRPVPPSGAKMDIVPSPGLMNTPFTTSPHPLIYDQEKPDRWGSCYNSTNPLSNPSTDSFVSDETYGLDDKFEDSNLQTLLTSEVMSSLQTSSANIPKEFQWGEKPDTINSVQTSTDSLGSTPTLAELNMESDLSIVSEILNLDPDENSALDFLCSSISSTLPSSVSSGSLNSTQPPTCFTSSSQNSQKSCDPKVISSTSQYGQAKSVEVAGDNYIRNYTPARNNFPPRASQPPLVGVVTPVKKEEDELAMHDMKSSSNYDKLQNQSPFLHKLLKQQTNSIKTECQSSVVSENKDTTCLMKSELPAQIVPPSTGAAKRNLNGSIKIEPTSPETAPVFHSEESIEQKWKDIENFIHNPEEPVVKKRKRCDSGGSEHTSDDDEFDEAYGDKDVDDSDDDDYSDIDDDLTRITPSECESLVATGKKQKQYFWQYNVQSKGPKGTRLKLAVESPSDPHVLNDFEDPVFDECNTLVAGIRHGGKARKGDGNEISPNPKKLFMIGHQLLRLNQQINACQLGPDVPLTKRNESRKEKNKLASRACRLKKKAQHEANKIKLYGLEQEHCQLNSVIKFIWPLLRERTKAFMSQMGKSAMSSLPSSSESLDRKLAAYRSEMLKADVAGKTVDYVNNVILKVESGDNSGGLDTRRSRKT
ncbi:CREB3 regulatory factor isoform X2 [Aplysia californica]|uniref:CREB3 regulatory factor isoform X2 n=1 Tax=Aplysia californica TaxID=6500 RepID=A0ABM0JB98_APLCA|nr:CREB3 regulatory factor isoform X2 [Aplysia californica]